MFIELLKEKYPIMTAGQKKVAYYISNNLNTVSYMTITQMAQEAGVSETTVVRLSYALGFSGFSDMQKAIRKNVIGNQESYRETGTEQTASDDSYAAIVDSDIEILQYTKKLLSHERLDEIGRIVAEAKQVFSIGFRTASSSAAWFAMALTTFREGVTVIGTNPMGFAPLIDADQGSVAVCVSFSRYSRESHISADYVKRHGGKLIVITDNELSPMAEIADYTILTKANKTVGINSQVSALSILNLILAAAVKNLSYYDRIQRIEEINESNNAYLE